ncbi:hypothetical protein A3709_20835 [Halioglobus sp. HI00S01]|nr:hypothetical protein A3709_20835 [Halioglobus sp. HI00S01]
MKGDPISVANKIKAGCAIKREVLSALVSNSEELRRIAAMSFLLSPKDIDRCLESKCANTRLGAASNPNLTASQARYIIAGETDRAVRDALLFSWRCPPSLLGEVLREGDDRDRYCAAQNLLTPPEDILAAAADVNPGIAATAKRHPLFQPATCRPERSCRPQD